MSPQPSHACIHNTVALLHNPQDAVELDMYLSELQDLSMEHSHEHESGHSHSHDHDNGRSIERAIYSKRLQNPNVKEIKISRASLCLQALGDCS